MLCKISYYNKCFKSQKSINPLVSSKYMLFFSATFNNYLFF
ncbi:hypothetical protein BMQ_pBM40058 (plasmid) [Priestia megaterium QM B1551]|uniref:Uncharacterized protein n=1 Tax=Priestia megaterium (strain ATCC 12872 / QMB1551) TaxID=545693 RepID=D5E3G4_PRIM1|nr:hypothetical protein BMQ_pBM40058 [Priestia megaterium QM B1551]